MIKLEDRLYTSTEVAEILGVSLRSVYRYLEENKLNAEVKTATGRHRFTKQNIINFLYPDGTDDNEEKASKLRVEKKEEPIKIEIEEKKVDAKEEKLPEALEEKEEEVQEEEVDWLAKFREAAQRFKEEAKEEAKEEISEKVEKQEPQPQEQKQEEVKPMVEEEPAFVQESFSGLAEVADDIKETPTTAQEEKQKIQISYYRSGLGGLKDIAQNIDKGARKSDLDYAFTLNAGLSLYKPIKPFSVLHVYVRSGDVEFYEKMLALTPTDEKNAQLCLVMSDDGDLYKNKEELHGLFVASKQRLLLDIEKSGDPDLVKEAQSVL